MDRIKVEYNGFQPATESVQKFKASFGFALGNGPSDASATALITNENKKYSCIVKVHSSQGHFTVSMTDSDLDTLYSKTCAELNIQFKEWHANPQSEKFSLKSAGHKVQN